MTAEVECDNDYSPESDEQSVGEMLRHARQAKRLSVEEIAKALKISAQYVHDLEAEDYAQLPAFTFVRGYIIRYGNVVGLDTTQLVQRIKEQMTASEIRYRPSVITVKTDKMSKWHRRIMIFLTLVIIFAFAKGTWWWLQRQKNTTISSSISQPESMESDSNAQKSLPQLSVHPAQESEFTEKKKALKQVVSADNPIEPIASNDQTVSLFEPESLAPEPAIDNNPAVIQKQPLSIHFSSACWLEITDKNGDIVYTNVGDETHPLDMMISPPFDIRFGNTPAVKSIHYASKAVTFSKNERITHLHINDNITD